MKIAVVSGNDRHLAEIARLLRERSPSDGVDVVYGALEKLAGIADLSSPDVLVLDQPSVEGGDLERLERLSHLYPRMAFILLCQQKTPEFLIQAMRAGVREVLPSPVDASELVPAIERVEQKLESSAQANGQVLAFVSCKGGSGATFLATNLGYALAVQEKKRVALIDLNLQFGDASLFVSDQKPQVTLSEVCQQIHRLDPSFFASSMLSIEPNYGVLAAPEDPTHASYVKPEHIDLILKLARRHYDFILLDMGRSLDAVSIRALDQADMIFPILQTTLPFIRDGKRLLNVFRSLDYRKDKIHLIVNRHEKNGEIRRQDLEAAYGMEVYRSIPNHYEAAAASVNQGVPILKLAKNSPVSKALQEFARSLVGDENQASQGWFSRVFQRA
ncbi:response regulator receiver domain protein (CheY-like) [Polaromonas sp. JS666]|nr:response regulator receiver domain protein (CheY-like) [Polaromonas sp. JS666]